MSDALVWGIDHSEVMFRQASKRNQRAISAGKVRLAVASVSQLPSFDGPFDKILDVNGFQFWDNKIDALLSDDERRILLAGRIPPASLV